MADLTKRVLLAGGVVAAGAAGWYFWKKSQTPDLRFGMVELGTGGAKWSVLQFTEAAAEQGVGADRYEGVQRSSRYERNEVASDDISVDVRDPANLEAVVSSVVRADEALANNGVLPDRRVIVASSSVAKLPAEHLEALLAALNAAGIEISLVTPEQEAEYAFRWLVPMADRSRTTFIDVGSGNIKGGYINEETDSFHAFEIPDGVSSLRMAAEALPGDIPINTRMETIVGERITPVLRQLAQRGIANDRMYLSGGTVWALRCITHPDVPADEAWVRLTANDIARYHEIVRADPTFDQLLEGVPANHSLRRKIAAVNEAISPPGRILAGGEVMAAISRELAFDSTPYIYFADEGQFAWSTMYLLTQMGLERI